ncbi:MAG TPA: hypothetical protein VLM40_17425 [Gemmata sp.]|nr:hypothetical protein [Gemmata sp.]
MATQTLSHPVARHAGPGILLLPLLAIWLSAIIVLAASGKFVTAAGLPPVALLTVVLLPIVLAVVAYAISPSVREFVHASDPALLTTLQSWRILGGTFLVLMSFGMLPAEFALPAGIGDMAIGFTAPFIARLAINHKRGARLFVIWQLLGILDLVVAVGTGASLRLVSTQADFTNAEQMIRMSELPLVLVPAFAVPIFVILHLMTLAQVRGQRERGDRDV